MVAMRKWKSHQDVRNRSSAPPLTGLSCGNSYRATQRLPAHLRRPTATIFYSPYPQFPPVPLSPHAGDGGCGRQDDK